MLLAELPAWLTKTTLAASLAILVVACLRHPVRRLFGARAAYGLWLALPAAILAMLLPSPTAPVPVEAVSARSAPVVVGASPSIVATVSAAANPTQLGSLLVGLWLLGAAAWMTVQAVRQVRYHRSLGPLQRGERELPSVHLSASDQGGPALIAGLPPRIVVPADFHRRFSAEEQTLIIAHERNHLRSGDVWINAALSVLQAIHWFNPLMHLAAALIRTDQELACDEATLLAHPSSKSLYAATVLKAQLAGPISPLGCHWRSEGVGALRTRLKMMKRLPSRTRRWAGALLAFTVALGGAYAAWAARPPRPQGDLIEAIQAGRRDLAEQLITAGDNVNLPRPGDGSPLIEAAKQGDLVLVRFLLDHGADPNYAVAGDGDPLIAAAANGNVAVIDLLTARGARVDSYVPGDETPLINAAREGRLEAVQHLVAAGADVNFAVMAPRIRPLPPELRSPLGMAERGGHRAVADFLRAHGARPPNSPSA